VIAILPLPYCYYQLLRIFVTIAFTYALVTNYRKFKKYVVAIHAIIIVVYNPLFTLHLDKSIWIIIDLALAITLASTIFIKSPNIENTMNNNIKNN
jgi:glycerol-3-phosphate acyltransferase PlsY